MPAVSIERLPVQLMGLGRLGFDHLQIVFQTIPGSGAAQEHWFVIEGIREADADGVRLGVEGWHGGTTLSDANGGLVGDALAARIGTSLSRGSREIAEGSDAVSLWAQLVAYAGDIEAQHFPYIPIALPSSPLPTINSSSLVASLLHHAGLDIVDALPSGLRLSPGMGTLLGTSEGDQLKVGRSFTSLVAGGGDDVLTGGDGGASIDKLYGGAGNDTFRWSSGVNILHGGQPGLSYGDDGIDTVDYSGAGHLRIEALPAGTPHRQADFVVHHERGRDYLFSIEEIVWDGARDRVVLGEGVGLATPGTDAPTAPAPDPARLEPLASGPFLDFRGPDDAILDSYSLGAGLHLLDLPAGG